ncbi:hypothetical protein RKLH11_1776 [Rhodobacteraceae bacterium KLH11]|nr:hypothetical protein RKLH11_1776 [Rhodobacteraceae bacterium KLH11]
MRTGTSGKIAISWGQTEIDGLEAAPLADMVVGAAWSWRGRGIELAADASRFVQYSEYAGITSLLAARSDGPELDRIAGDLARIELTNGAQTFVAELMGVAGEASLLLVFADGCPEPDQDFWISAAAPRIEPIRIDHAEDDKVVVFPVAHMGRPAVSGDRSRVAGIAAE